MRPEDDQALLCTPTPLLPKPHLFRELRACCGIIWRDHRVVGIQTPFLAILLGRHVVLGTQMPLQRFEFLAVFEADNVLGGN